MANWSKSKSNYSSFWLDDDVSNIDILTGEKISNGKDYIKMASSLKAISNFVKIVSGNDIKCEYSNRDESYTDGKTVTVSSKVNGKSFDSTVGLALHEGSHCLLSDFKLLQNIFGYSGYDILERDFNFKFTKEMELQGITKNTLKDVLNIIEDRRIDKFVFDTAPGYQGYYAALYNRYFHDKAIDKGLLSSSHRDLDLNSYFFRICNITNANRDLKALPGLQDIYNAIDLGNISRLKSTTDALLVAFKVITLISENLPIPKSEEDGEGNCDNPGENESQEAGNDSNGNNSGECNTPTEESLLPDLSSADQHKLRKAIDKQKEFISNNIKKSSIRKGEKKKIDAINKSNATYNTVGSGQPGRHWGSTSNGTECLVIRNINQSVIDSNVFETLSAGYYSLNSQQEAINNGIRLGTQLGRKLQVRNESRDLKYNRLNQGKIDKRMISSAGFGNENIFQQVFIDNHKDANVHISIDASGSMSGSKWLKSMTSAIAIAKAASMVGNLNVTISFRSTEQQGNKYLPAIFLAYDSKKDKIQKIQKLFKYIQCPGTTPEGLCFEAIQNEILSSSNNLDSYFINFSDGEPYFENKDIQYYGKTATKHTALQVNKFKEKGIKVLSYFITGSATSETSDSFKTMYGSDASNINTNNLSQLAKTLNNMFIEK